MLKTCSRLSFANSNTMHRASPLSENNPISFLSFTSPLRKDISSSCFFFIRIGNATCVTRLTSTRVTACCLRRKEGEFRTFRSYTEEDIFLWVWFNRQEAADSHFSVMLFLWVQDSQVSLWVFFFFFFSLYPVFKICHWYFWLPLFPYRAPKQESQVCCTTTCMLDEYI